MADKNYLDILLGLGGPSAASDLLGLGSPSAVSDLFGSSPSWPTPANKLAKALATTPPKTPTNALANFGDSLSAWPTPTNKLGNVVASTAVTDLFGNRSPWPTPTNKLGNVVATAPPKLKRRAYFAFHFDDIMRVNNVRKSWKIGHPDNALYPSFVDSSLWEARKTEGDDAIKRLIREGVEYTSAVCVLAGTYTFVRPWVRYEIARAVIDGRGLLTVHINGLNHHETKGPHPRSENPLNYMAVGKDQYGPSYHLWERNLVWTGTAHEFQWQRYGDYTHAVDRPAWLADCQPGWLMPLAANAAVYDYATQLGHKNIGSWIDTAASRAGR